MTREKFYQENCLMCGTLRCPKNDEAISTCERYKGDIDGIEKQEILYELLKRANKAWREWEEKMVGVILFRAQPFHNGHLNMIKKAMDDCRNNNCDLYIFVGSADKFGTMRNPLPIDFRLMLIEGALHETFPTDELKHIHIFPLDDLTDEADNSYNWGRYLFMKMLNKTKDPDMTIYYSDKPEIMLSWFDAEDRWALRFKFLDRYEGISATKVRKLICDSNTTTEEILKVVPNFVYMHLEEIIKYIMEGK